MREIKYREIKFRVWIDESKKDPTYIARMEYYDPVKNLTENSYIKEGDPIMQYTGIKCGNGQEIYEGDIIETSQGNKWLALWEDGIKLSPAWRFYSVGMTERRKKNLEETYGESLFNDQRRYLNEVGVKYAKIIGNIYENPECLK